MANINASIVAALKQRRAKAAADVEKFDELIVEFGGTSGKVKRTRRTKAEIAAGSEVAGEQGSPQPATFKYKSSRSEKMKARWAERKAKEAAEKGEAPQTEGADLAAAAGD